MPEGLQAGGNVKPKRIVRLTSAGDNQVIQASAATSPVLGISGQGTRYAEITGLTLNDGYTAVGGENVKVFTVGESAPLVAGSGGVSPEDLVTSDNDGRGITAGTDGQFYVGQAMQAAAEGEAFMCKINPGQRAS